MKYLFNTLLALFPVSLLAQEMPVTDREVTARYPFVTTVFNRVLNNTGLDSFYSKLYKVKSTGKGQVRIVHIGDSHIQADYLSGTVRKGLQDFAGNAGRGLVFPYQLAQSNAPADIISSSNVSWRYNRLAKPVVDYPCGIAGFVLNSQANAASISISLRPTDQPQSFNILRLFATGSDNVSWRASVVGSDSSYVVNDSATRLSVVSGSVLLERKGIGETNFHGVSMELDTTGVIYHTIGVNGARYDQYNDTGVFWEQLPALEADLYIISLGTNEAQAATFAGSRFISELEIFLDKLKTTSPSASILITTAPDSYKFRASNKVLRQLNETLTRYCNEKFIPLWDLYRITNGHGSAYSWARRGLMSRDKVHFTADGYRLQGMLLYNALAKGYNDYVRVFGKN